MTQKTISQESAATRLLTGALVEIEDVAGGSLNVSVDTLLQGPTFDTPTQIVGNTAANTMEVEAHSLAARLTLRPDEINNLPSGWKIGRHVYCASNFGYVSGGATTTVNAPVLEFAWINVAGIAIIKKVFFDLAIGSSNNTVNGTANAQIVRTFGLGPLLDVSNVQIPASQSGNSVGGRSPITGTTGMKSNQPPAQARVNGGINRTSRGSGAGEQAWVDPNGLGLVECGLISGAGKTLFRRAALYDHLVAEHPLILVPGTGFEVQWTLPTFSNASTTTIMPYATVYWDEWTLSNPGDPK